MTPSKTSIPYRSDINGLRAIAVIAVVLFHFNPSWVPGGFAGVDVFFVISGFLMTGIIFRGVEQDNFSILRFYVARANRIIPALAVLCLVLLIFGWFYLTPMDYKALGKHVAGSMAFISNILYWRESGYFDAASLEKWLLHTWSLSVEWQFYIIYPLVLIAIKKFISKQAIKPLILIGTVLSFVLCVILTYKSPSAAYYLLPTRAWEMLMGGVAYLYPFNASVRQKRVLELTGLSFIIGSYFLVSADTSWPGYIALFPVLGTFFIIQAQRNESILTGNIVFKKIGLWSYSIYLWHWPLVAATYYFSLSDLFVYVFIATSLLLGFISYKYIEPIKLPNNHSTYISYLTCKPICIAIITATVGSVVFILSPTSHLKPLPDGVLKSIERKEYKCFDKNYQHQNSNPLCRLTSGETKAIAIGDSHSYSLLPAIENISKNKNIELHYAGYSGCPPLLSISPLRQDQDIKNCSTLNDKILKEIKDAFYDYILLTARWTYYTDGNYSNSGVQALENTKGINSDSSVANFTIGVQDTFKEYSQLVSKVIVTLQIPMQERNPDYIYYKSLRNKKIEEELLVKNSISTTKHNEFQRKTNDIIINEAAKYNNIFIADPTSIMCNEDNCPVGDALHSFYFDDDHLSIIGSSKLEPMLNNMIQPYQEALK